jgi:hypothetical protein
MLENSQNVRHLSNQMTEKEKKGYFSQTQLEMMAKRN